jgi:zinc/manganese transport system substrate-binding protein
VTSDLKQLDAKDAAYFDQQQQSYLSSGLQQYTALIQRIKQTYAGTPVGASESIFTPLAHALGLKLVTPSSFLKAISEGTEPTASDKSTVDDQISRRLVKVWVYNSQNATPDVKRITDAARRRGIPVTTVTETLVPSSGTFEGWQVRQLRALAAALAQATGR